jgi:uncharacterized protein YjbI with pentapeptide repeats
MPGYGSPLGIITGFPRISSVHDPRIQNSQNHAVSKTTTCYILLFASDRTPSRDIGKNHFESVADEEQLKILQQGIAAWNDWRARNPELMAPDLSGADLRRANLSGAYFEDAQLRGADFRGANLSKAYLGFGEQRNRKPA